MVYEHEGDCLSMQNMVPVKGWSTTRWNASACDGSVVWCVPVIMMGLVVSPNPVRLWNPIQYRSFENSDSS